APMPTISNLGPFCEDGPVIQLVGSPLGGDWGGAADFRGRIDPGFIGPGIFPVFYDYIDQNGCMGSALEYVTIEAATPVFIDPIPPVCVEGGIQQITATPPGGTWGGAVDNFGQFDPAFFGPGFHTVNYSFTNAQGCTSTEEIEVEVIEPPVIDVFNNERFCYQDQLSIIYADPFGGTWSGDVNEFGEFNPVVLGPGFHNATYY